MINNPNLTATVLYNQVSALCVEVPVTLFVGNVTPELLLNVDRFPLVKLPVVDV